MKNTIILTFLLLSTSFVNFAQQNEGIVYYTRTSRWTKMIETIDYMSKQEREKMAYMFNNKDEWKTYNLLYFNDKEAKYINSEQKSEESEGYSDRKSEYIIKRNFEKNTKTDIIEMLGKVYIVEDSLITPNWKILNDIKDVAGHICMKAMVEDTIKKQKIVAWFAQDIPVSAGPERLYGLPGLILELDINNGAVIIEATKIENKKLVQELDLPKKMKGKKVNEAAYQEVIRKHMADMKKAEEYPFYGIRY
jgi:GLPGLI family protein